MTNQRWQIWLTALAAVWVFLSPWILANAASTVAAPLSNGAEWNLWIAGGVAAVLSIAALIAYRPWEEWISAIIGLWLIASPWIFSFSDATAMVWATALAGGVILLAGLWSIIVNPETRRFA